LEPVVVRKYPYVGVVLFSVVRRRNR
jgi:hypothetical protein